MKFQRISTLLLFTLLFLSKRTFALDSYRYLHVTIDTPWNIFLFLLLFILAPFILMIVLMWRYSKSNSIESEQPAQSTEIELGEKKTGETS